jgi:hypothetical protein
MIEPTEADIGKMVYYQPKWMPFAYREKGVITGMNDTYVWVRYGEQIGSQATKRDDLEWELIPTVIEQLNLFGERL